MSSLVPFIWHKHFSHYRRGAARPGLMTPDETRRFSFRLGKPSNEWSRDRACYSGFVCDATKPLTLFVENSFQPPHFLLDLPNVLFPWYPASRRIGPHT